MHIPRAVGERIESTLDRIVVSFKPAFGPEALSIVTPHVRTAVDGVRRYTEDRALRERLAKHSEATFRNNTREPNARCRVNTESLVNDRLKVWQAFDCIKCRDRIIITIKRFVKLLLEFLLAPRVCSEMIRNGA